MCMQGLFEQLCEISMCSLGFLVKTTIWSRNKFVRELPFHRLSCTVKEKLIIKKGFHSLVNIDTIVNTLWSAETSKKRAEPWL